MIMPKSEMIRLLKLEGIYSGDVYEHIRCAIRHFYSRFNGLNIGKEDFQKKEDIPPAGYPSDDIRREGFLNAFSRLIYDNNSLPNSYDLRIWFLVLGCFCIKHYIF